MADSKKSFDIWTEVMGESCFELCNTAWCAKMQQTTMSRKTDKLFILGAAELTVNCRQGPDNFKQLTLSYCIYLLPITYSGAGLLTSRKLTSVRGRNFRKIQGGGTFEATRALRNHEALSKLRGTFENLGWASNTFETTGHFWSYMGIFRNRRALLKLHGHLSKPRGTSEVTWASF